MIDLSSVFNFFYHRKLPLKTGKGSNVNRKFARVQTSFSLERKTVFASRISQFKQVHCAKSIWSTICKQGEVKCACFKRLKYYER